MSGLVSKEEQPKLDWTSVDRALDAHKEYCQNLPANLSLREEAALQTASYAEYLLAVFMAVLPNMGGDGGSIPELFVLVKKTLTKGRYQTVVVRYEIEKQAQMIGDQRMFLKICVSGSTIHRLNVVNPRENLENAINAWICRYVLDSNPYAHLKKIEK
jgi:hypothetical protein